MGAVIFCATNGCDSELGGGDPEQLMRVSQPWTCDDCKRRLRGEEVPRRTYERPMLTEISPPHFPTPEIAPPRCDGALVERCRARAPDGTLDGPQCTRADGHEGPHENKGGNSLGGWVWSDRGKPPEKVDYGPTCEARFALPVQVCKLAPGHAGDHDACVRGSEEVKRLDLLDERIEVLHWARSRPGVMRLLAVLREHDYDEAGTEYLRRLVDGRGASGERSAPPARETEAQVTRLDLDGALVEEGREEAWPLAACLCTFAQVDVRHNYMTDQLEVSPATSKGSRLFERRTSPECGAHAAKRPTCKYCGEPVEREGEVHAGGCGNVG